MEQEYRNYFVVFDLDIYKPLILHTKKSITEDELRKLVIEFKKKNKEEIGDKHLQNAFIEFLQQNGYSNAGYEIAGPRIDLHDQLKN